MLQTILGIQYLCTDFATFSKWHYIIVQNQGEEDHMNTFQSAVKSVLYNLY